MSIMADFLTLHQAYLRLNAQADGYDEIAQKLDGFHDRARLTQRGPFLGPLGESQGRAFGALRSASALVRSAASACQRRSEIVLEFSADEKRWDLTYGDFPSEAAPPRPVWPYGWSNT